MYADDLYMLEHFEDKHSDDRWYKPTNVEKWLTCVNVFKTMLDIWMSESDKSTIS